MSRSQTRHLVAATLVICLLGTAIGLRLAARADDADPVVQTASGRLRGVRLPEGGVAFRGIPFAAPPVGLLRWEPPAQPAAWSGVRDATEFSAACVQPLLGEWNRMNAEHGREDCLYLNVSAPAWPAQALLPVMVWIHGGGNMGGTGGTPFFAVGGLERRGVILVTINYRLDVFGFFAHPALRRASPHASSGNYALLDQIAALGWVRDNIAHFGGDPRNVTVFGQSAGAIDIAALMASPLAKGLFHKAISQSGSITRHPTPLADLEAAGEAWIRRQRVPPGQDQIAYLRGLDGAALLAAAKAKDGPALPVEQAIDGWVLPRTPAEAFHAGTQAPVPMIVGHTSRELPVMKTADAVRADIERGVPSAFKPQVLGAYGLADGGAGLADDPILGPLSVQFIVDVQFRCTAYLQRTWLEASGHAAYGYQFDRTPPGHEAGGAQHSAELPYVFGSFAMAGVAEGDADRRLSDVIQRYWTNFAKTGDPNGPGLPPWPRFGTTGSAIEFLPDGTAAARPGFRRTQCEAFRAAVESESMYRASAADNPFVGDWKLIPSRTTLTDQMKVGRVGDNKYVFDFAGDGHGETIVLDGTDQPGNAGTTLAVTSEGPNAWTVVRKKDGRKMLSAAWTLSSDGQTLTDHYTNIPSNGSPTTTKYVYRRHGTGSGFAGTWITTNMAVNFDLVLQFRPYDGDGLSMTDSMSQLTRNMKSDGKDYPNAGQNASILTTSSLRRLDTQTLELTDKRSDGTVFDTQEMKLSPDLGTLTVTQRITGRAVPSILVFERQ